MGCRAGKGLKHRVLRKLALLQYTNSMYKIEQKWKTTQEKITVIQVGKGPDGDRKGEYLMSLKVIAKQEWIGFGDKIE